MLNNIYNTFDNRLERYDVYKVISRIGNGVTHKKIMGVGSNNASTKLTF